MDAGHITQDELKRLLDYDTETGMFTWKVVGGRNIFEGKKAGRINQDGYIEIKVAGKIYKAHRLAWLWLNGDIPPIIDHINRDRADNRPCNLRPATRSQNRTNSILFHNNATGFMGVTKRHDCNRFNAKIRADGKNKHLGNFLSAEEAHAAYVREAIRLHGEFVTEAHVGVTNLIGETKDTKGA